ncbi:MAG: hypothetical protein J6J51_01740, partial [Clostridia bacterium]|nr:hypothetical protein [Clostridia bacterium]
MKRIIAILTTLAMLLSVSVFAADASAEVQGTYEVSADAQEVTIRISVSGLEESYDGFYIDGMTLPEGFEVKSFSTSNAGQAITGGDYTAATGKLTYITSDTEPTIPADTYYDVVISVPANAEGDFDVTFSEVVATTLYCSTE